MSPKLEKNNSGPESIVSQLAGFANEVVSGLRKDADKKMDAREENLAQISVRLKEIQELFSGETDVVKDKSELELGLEQTKAFFDLIRALLGKDPLKPGEKVPDLNEELVLDEVNGNYVNVGGQKVGMNQLDFLKIKDGGERLVNAAAAAVGLKDDFGAANCWEWIKKVHDSAEMALGKVVYQDTINGKARIGSFNPDHLVPGAWIYFWNGNPYGGEHSAMIKSFDPITKVAVVYSYPGGKGKHPRVHQVPLAYPPGPNGKMGLITHIRLPARPSSSQIRV